MAGDPPHSSQFQNKVASEFEENIEVNLATISASNLELSFLVLGAHSFHSALFGVPSKSRDGFVDGFPAEDRVILHENHAILHKIRNEFHGWATGKKMKMIIRSPPPFFQTLSLRVFIHFFSFLSCLLAFEGWRTHLLTSVRWTAVFVLVLRQFSACNL